MENRKNPKMSITVGITDAFTKAAKSIAEQAIKDATAMLSAKYGFDPDEAIAYLLTGNLETAKEVPPNDLPYCGRDDTKCIGIVTNRQLYTQCTQKPVDGSLCKKCASQVAQHGTPTNGDVYQRDACEGLYKVGRRVEIPYHKFMKRHGYTQEGVLKTAAKLGLTIDPKHFEEHERKPPGRPVTTKMRMETPVVDLPDPPAEPPAEPEKSKKNSKKSKKNSKVEPDPVETDAPDVSDAPAAPDEPVVEHDPVEQVNESDELEEEEVSEEEEYTAEEIEKMLVADLRKLAESRGIPTRDDGKLISPGKLRTTVREHLKV